MKPLFLFLILCALPRMASAADLSGVSRSEILATVDHIEALCHQQKAELAMAVSNYNGAILALKEQTVLSAQYKAEAKANARQRDVFLICIAIFGSLYFGTLFCGMILREFPMPWSVICVILVYAGYFVAIYEAGRACVASLARLIP
jgi:hypothetical protein